MSEGNEAQNEASNGTNMIELGIQAVVKDAVDAKFNDWVHRDLTRQQSTTSCPMNRLNK